jgi:hypothetical protein
MDVFFNKNYYVLVTVILLFSLFIYMNPASLQNQRYKLKGDACPNALWYFVIFFILGTGLYYLVNRFGNYSSILPI